MSDLGFAPENILPYLIRALILLTMLPVHEFAHGFAADRLGDDTPRAQGRLTLNPFAHLDWTGSILIMLVGIGWGKPVSVDMRNFEHPRRDMAVTALAGPLSNLLLSFFLMLLYKILLASSPQYALASNSALIADILGTLCFYSIMLAVFNLIPLPPLDGSKILGILLPQKIYWAMLRYQRQITFVFMLLLIFRVLTFPIQFATSWVFIFFDRITMPVEWWIQLWTRS